MLTGNLKRDNSLNGSLSLPESIQGKSAYEVALMNGFVGTQEMWLESLKGEKGDKGDSFSLTVETKMGDLPTGEVVVGDRLKIKGTQGVRVSVDGDGLLFGIDGNSFPGGNGNGSGLPEVTEADNGKIPMVVGGKWENVKYPAGTQYKSVTATIPASSWNDNGSMIHAVWYGLGTSVDGCDIDISLAASSAKEQFEEAARCGVYCSSATGTELVFTALYAIPTIDLTFDIRITKPTTLAYSVDEASMTLTIVEGYDG